MGLDMALFMANLFLYHFEANWIKSLKKENLQKARRFSNTFRFIDDLLTINDNNLFLENFESIYNECFEVANQENLKTKILKQKNCVLQKTIFLKVEIVEFQNVYYSTDTCLDIPDMWRHLLALGFVTILLVIFLLKI